MEARINIMAGDKVVCHNAVNTDGLLSNRAEYFIKELVGGATDCFLVGYPGRSFNLNRFLLAPDSARALPVANHADPIYLRDRIAAIHAIQAEQKLELQALYSALDSLGFALSKK